MKKITMSAASMSQGTIGAYLEKLSKEKRIWSLMGHRIRIDLF